MLIDTLTTADGFAIGSPEFLEVALAGSGTEQVALAGSRSGQPPPGDLSACCEPLVAAPLSPEAARQLAGVLKALSDPARLRLLSLIAAHSGGEACVCDLTEPLGLTQPTVSHHLKQLVDAGLIRREKRGVWAYYRLVPAALEQLASLLAGKG